MEFLVCRGRLGMNGKVFGIPPQGYMFGLLVAPLGNFVHNSGDQKGGTSFSNGDYGGNLELRNQRDLWIV